MRPARVCFSGFLSWTGYRIYHFCLNQGNDLSIFVLTWVKCLKQGIKNRNSVLKWVGKLAIFVLNRVRVWGAAPYLPTQGYVEYPPPPPGWSTSYILLLKRNLYVVSIFGKHKLIFSPGLFNTIIAYEIKILVFNRLFSLLKLEFILNLPL